MIEIKVDEEGTLLGDGKMLANARSVEGAALLICANLCLCPDDQPISVNGNQKPLAIFGTG